MQLLYETDVIFHDPLVGTNHKVLFVTYKIGSKIMVIIAIISHLL